MNPGEHLLAGYAKQHGYAAEFEPDWAARFGRHFETNPDFLLAGRDAEAVVEVRDFNTRPLEGHRGGSVNPAILRRPLYYGIKRKAEQLIPFAETGVPLVIALANTTGAQVDLEDYEMNSVMFGEVGISMPFDPATGELDMSAARQVTEPGYGAFCGTDSEGRPVNRWSHVSGVAVLRRYDRYREFQDRDLARYVEERDPASSEERAHLAVEWCGTPVGRSEAPGPIGFDFAVTYYDLAGYRLGAGPPVPGDWFAAPRDRRLGFDIEGRFGEGLRT